MFLGHEPHSPPKEAGPNRLSEIFGTSYKSAQCMRNNQTLHSDQPTGPREEKFLHDRLRILTRQNNLVQSWIIDYIVFIFD